MISSMPLQRLDTVLVDRGLFPSREKARRAVMAGIVRVNGHTRDKASYPCSPDAIVDVRQKERFVSRGGYKLEAALNHFAINPTGFSCLDIGASTGGFTDCLLQSGASKVIALDVGHSQMNWSIRQDARVDAREGINARYLKPEDFQERFPLIVTDVSFISLRLILPAAFPLLAPGGKVCALIKPQFEAGREEVGKGGIVRDPEVHQRVVNGLLEWLKGFPIQSMGVIPSPITGTDGNHEFLWGMAAI